MSFIERAFTPPGTGAFVPPPMATPAVQAAMGPPPAAPPPPAPPVLPAAPPAPPQFQPGQAPGAKQKAAVTATTMLGTAATAGQQSKKTLLGA